MIKIDGYYLDPEKISFLEPIDKDNFFFFICIDGCAILISRGSMEEAQKIHKQFADILDKRIKS